jgi:hypothetical protein
LIVSSRLSVGSSDGSLRHYYEVLSAASSAGDLRRGVTSDYSAVFGEGSLVQSINGEPGMMICAMEHVHHGSNCRLFHFVSTVDIG